MEDSLYKQPDLSSHQPVADDKDKTLTENATDKPMDVDLEAPVTSDDFGGAVDGPFMGAYCGFRNLNSLILWSQIMHNGQA